MSRVYQIKYRNTVIGTNYIYISLCAAKNSPSALEEFYKAPDKTDCIPIDIKLVEVVDD